tara:strand:- start:4072 stop:4785 length:714 start_codon:yes stop_codon:yes gene_type:complete
MRKKEITIVVGGSKGIGKAIYLNLKKQNKNVFVISRSLKKSKNFINLDLSSPKLIKREIEIKIKKKFKVKSLIFCQRYRGDDLYGHFEIGLFSSKYFIDALGKSLIKNSSIVFINSIASQFIVSEQNLGYHLSKAALENFVKYYAVKFGEKQIRFNSISPGTVVKPESKKFFSKSKKYKLVAKKIIPLKRLCKTDDIVNLTNFLCSDKASYITGQNIFLDGGLSVLGQETVARKFIK